VGIFLRGVRQVHCSQPFFFFTAFAHYWDSMPLARIITDSIDDSLELTMQLRSRGFQVETVPPGDVPNTPADLEVRLEECDSEDVLMRTAQAAEADDLWVFVAPGALDESARPMRTIPLMPAVIRESEVMATAVRPKTKVPPAVLPFSIPDDDPILLELVELNPQATSAVAIESQPTNGHSTVRLQSSSSLPAAVGVPPLPKTGTAHTSASEIPEVVIFPVTSKPQLSVRSVSEEVQIRTVRQTADLSLSASEDLRFWRIASVVAALAIAALLLGANLTRSQQPTSHSPQGVAPALPQSHQNATSASGRNALVPTPAKPKVGVQSNLKPKHPPIVSATDAKRLREPQTKHAAAKPSNDEVVARDTVVYFDGSGRRLTRKPASNQGVKPQPDTN
jgi:hypothetical protein